MVNDQITVEQAAKEYAPHSPSPPSPPHPAMRREVWTPMGTRTGPVRAVSIEEAEPVVDAGGGEAGATRRN